MAFVKVTKNQIRQLTEAAKLAGIDEIILKSEEDPGKNLENLALEAISQGKAEGFTKGYAEGLSQGRTEGFRQGFQDGADSLKRTIAVFTKATADLSTPLQGRSEQIAQLISVLALSAAKSIVGSAFTASPGLIKTIVEACLVEAVSAKKGPNQKIILKIHPSDKLLISENTADVVEIETDGSLSPGGCIVIVSQPDDVLDTIEFDARLETRWRDLMAAIHIQDDFLQKGEPL